ncbi:putative aminopeptidase W07G4.4 [Cyprinus carpio]|uniref:Aminopeptidase W07G4.4 n=1 Tax=Cyprinus carpio TaxID=7962 RepID=A0A9Q9WKF2_CYPCA|nr:putative aminopeptidase W07G4.4 [Cyprinus carpio]
MSVSVQPLQCTTDCKDQNFDGILLICQSYEQLPDELECLKAPLQDYSAVDCCVGEEVVVVRVPGLSGNRLVFSCTGPVNRDYDDVRRFSDAAGNGIKRALKAGMQRPLLVCPPHSSYAKSTLVAVLGALHVLYTCYKLLVNKEDLIGFHRMHRDKCGSAAVAGFFQILAKLKPKHLKVVGAMAMVRNSVGSDCYVADELVVSRAGRRIRVGNTDAEGRMVMVDLLCEMKEQALREVSPHLFTIATLTGHAVRAMGPHYSIIMDNGAAHHSGNALQWQKAGEVLGDLFEVSTIRREDYDFHKGKSEYEDILQANNLPSSATPRGHQTPAAFLIMASGLDKHGVDSDKPLPYSHTDIAGSSGPFPGVPTGAPILAMATKYLEL